MPTARRPRSSPAAASSASSPSRAAASPPARAPVSSGAAPDRAAACSRAPSSVGGSAMGSGAGSVTSAAPPAPGTSAAASAASGGSRPAVTRAVAHALRRVDELEAEPAAVAEEHLVDVPVEAALHAAQLAVARRERRRAAQAAVRAHRRRRLQVPLARVPARERLVVEHAGRAHLDEVAAELALQRAALGAPEVHLVAQAERAEVPASGVVVVEARAAVAGDAAVQLVGDERSQVLVLERPLAAAVAPVAVPAHHGHVLQVALAALVADGAVVRVAEHHELDHLGAEADGLGVEDVHLRALLRLRHAGHGDLALLVALAVGPVQAHRALAAGADGAQHGVPAEERQVEAEREGDVEHVAALFGLVLGAVDDDGDDLGRLSVAAHQVVPRMAGASEPRRR